MAKSGRLELGDNIRGHYRSMKNRKIRAIMPLKVIQGHRGRYKSKACMRLPVSD